MSVSPLQLSEAYIQACELELQAFKPGNVSIYSDGHDMTVEDFIISAKASSDSIVNPEYSLGEKIFYAVKATKEAVGCNTNLGIILLSAPLLTAAYRVTEALSLEQALAQVLAETTVSDADWVFKAICLAAPGGLGESKEQDVTQTATMTLTQAMAIAANRDRIALQYLTNYKDIFNFAILRYNTAYNFFYDKAWAALAVYIALLSRYPDSHIERKYGTQYNLWVAEKITPITAALESYQRDDLMTLLYRVDAEFKAKGINPGTTADLTVATVLVAYLDELLGFNRRNRKLTGRL